MDQGPFKVNMLGDWRSGRSSVVAALSGRPCPEHPGIQVTRWRPDAEGPVLEIWDVNSRCTLESLGQAFLAHSDALVAVADTSRADSVEAACHALRAALGMLGPRPASLLLNRRRDEALPALSALPEGVAVHAVRASTGHGVAEAFRALAGRLQEGGGRAAG